MKFIIKTEIIAKNQSTRSKSKLVEILDGLKSDECFCDYIQDGRKKISGAEKINEGYLSIKYNSAKDVFESHVQYQMNQLLNEEEVNSIVAYTIGQIRDGIGQNLFQELSRSKNINVVLPMNPIIEINIAQPS